MTVIQVCRHNGFPAGVSASGHSGYAESGEDIVCAAVSVLIQTLYIGVVDVLGLSVTYRIDEKQPLIELTWKDRSGKELRVLAETIFKALKATAESYSDYLKFVEVS